MAVVLDDDTASTRSRVMQILRGRGVKIAHAFDGLLLVDVPSGEDLLSDIAGVYELSPSPLPRGRARGRTAGFRLGLEAWNAGVRDPEARAGLLRRPRGRTPALTGEHAWLPPVSPASAEENGSTPAGIGVSPTTLARSTDGPSPSGHGVPYGATEQNTSEYLAGTISVNVVLAESDGTIEYSSENWTADREAAVVNGIVTALEWVRSLEPQARLGFVYHVYPGRTDPRARTGYEPIRRPADPHGSQGEDLWVGQILAKMGYASGDRFARSRLLAHATRVADGTDWGLNLFVADSNVDPDGAFADGHFAYTWVGGPHLVLTYDNQAWGIARMDMVVRHETLHAFYAFDEYRTSSCSCTARRGYLDGTNANCDACNLDAAPCVMIANGEFLCTHTGRQIGWADLDGDGIVDVVGEDPDTFLDAVPAIVCSSLEITGTAAVVAPTNRNPMTVTPRVNISIATVAAVEVRRGPSDEWTPALPVDGVWDEPVESFRFTAALSAGLHEVEARAKDSLGNVDSVPAVASVDVRPAAGSISSALVAARHGASAIALGWGAAPGATAYRIYRAPTPSGPWTVVAETAATGWVDEPSGSASYRVVGLDACGVEGP